MCKYRPEHRSLVSVEDLNEDPPSIVNPDGQWGYVLLRRPVGHRTFCIEDRAVAGANEGAVRAAAGKSEKSPVPTDKEKPLVAETVVYPFFSKGVGRPSIDGPFTGNGRLSVDAGFRHGAVG